MFKMSKTKCIYTQCKMCWWLVTDQGHISFHLASKEVRVEPAIKAKSNSIIHQNMKKKFDICFSNF